MYIVAYSGYIEFAVGMHMEFILGRGREGGGDIAISTCFPWIGFCLQVSLKGRGIEEGGFRANKEGYTCFPLGGGGGVACTYAKDRFSVSSFCFVEGGTCTCSEFPPDIKIGGRRSCV